MGKSYLMQDGATPHTANKTLKFLYTNFRGRVISGKYQEKFNCGLTWPAHSPDLNPCDFLLWGYLKSKVYNRPLNSIEELETQILEQVDAIPKEMLQKCFQSFLKRLRAVIAAEGCHIEHDMRQ